MHHSFLVISNINDALTDSAEDLDIVIPVYNLIEYNKKLLRNIWYFMELSLRYFN